MPGKKKKFIDKKSAVTFHLVHRSQRDPLTADDEAPQHVLVEHGAEEKGNAGEKKQKEEQIKYGIYFDDDYNYLQHLRDLKELNEVSMIHDAFRVGQSAADPQLVVQSERSTKLVLPSSVFGSGEETGVGLLNKAVALVGPQPDLDPDIVAAMDEDFDFENPDLELEDDFMQLANSGDVKMLGANDDGDDAEWETDEDDDDVSSNEAQRSEDDEEEDEVRSLGEFSFRDEETKSRFTDYSMSSSVIRRNNGLTLLDDRFEKFYESYDRDEIGALDGEDIEGTLGADSAVLKQMLDEFENDQKVVKMKDVIERGTATNPNCDENDSEGDTEEEEKEKLFFESTDSKKAFDCESILSTKSTLYNHPKTIPNQPSLKNKIRLTRRAEIPCDVLPVRGQTARQTERETEGETERERLVQPLREKGETAEERRARKQTVKELRRTRRETKTGNKKAFKDEKIRQDKEMINIKQNLQAVRIV